MVTSRYHSPFQPQCGKTKRDKKIRSFSYNKISRSVEHNDRHNQLGLLKKSHLK